MGLSKPIESNFVTLIMKNIITTFIGITKKVILLNLNINYA